MRKSLLALLLAVCVGSVSAQSAAFWSNAGAVVSIRDTSYISVLGDMYNSNHGLYYNYDSIFLTGDWSNSAGNHAFDSIQVPAGTGYVYMYAADQRIRGTDQTYFHNLVLRNQGTKFADIDAKVDGFLDMTDREFNVDTNTIWVRNPRLNSVRRTTGFLSSQQDGGLLRYTDADSTYLYPVGSSLVTTRYRPIEVTPTSVQHNQFKVRFANVDPTTEGYDRNIRYHLVCSINQNWYHRIYHPQGTDSADLSIFYDPAADGQWNDIAHWQHIPEWEAIFKDAQVPGSPFTRMTKNHWNDFRYSPFALAIISPPYANAGPDDSICSGASDTLGIPNQGAGYIYNWTPTAGLNDSTLSDPTYTMANLGTTNDVHTLTLLVNYIGCTDTDRVNVTVFPKPRPVAGTNDSICSGVVLTLGGNTQSGYTYVWSPSAGLSDTTISDPVFNEPNLTTVNNVYNYTLNVVENGCKDSAKIAITVYPKPRPDAGPDAAICSGASVGLGINPQPGYTYLWSPATGLSNPSISDPVFGMTNLTTDNVIYNLTIHVIENGCKDSDKVNITVYPKPRPDAGPDASICSDVSLRLGIGPQKGYTYIWSPPNGLSNPTISDPVFNLPNPGNANAVYDFTLNVIENGCKDSDKVTITVYPMVRPVAGVDTILWDKDSIHLVSYGGVSYAWSPDYNINSTTTDHPVVNPEHSTVYYVVVTDANLCTGYDSVYVIVREKPFSNIFIPDVITPNGDGFNDIWHIRDLERYPDNEVRIINRWGDELLFQKPYQQDWAGTWHGEPLPGATYYYVIKIRNAEGTEASFNGPITVVR